MSEMAEIDLELRENGVARLVVNGDDVSNLVNAVAVQAQPGEPPLLTVRLVSKSAQISGPGVVRVESQADSTNRIFDFLDSLDPEELEQAILKDSGWGSNVGETALEVLKRWANGYA